MAFNRTERRAYPRRAYFHLIKYVLNLDTLDRIFRGFTINISSSGLRLYTFNNLLTEGQEVTIISSLAGFQSSPKGTVRWINKLYDNTYEIGLEFA
jgi:hypothetical protein